MEKSGAMQPVYFSHRTQLLVISNILTTQGHLCFLLSTFKVQTVYVDSHIIHVLPKRGPHYIRMCVLDVLTQLATRGF